jgi:hypothetical protein
MRKTHGTKTVIILNRYGFKPTPIFYIILLSLTKKQTGWGLNPTLFELKDSPFSNREAPLN